jgi:hypothetical protein
LFKRKKKAFKLKKNEDYQKFIYFETSSQADYPFKGTRGPLCYVGTFGSSAPVTGFINRQIPGGAILVGNTRIHRI